MDLSKAFDCMPHGLLVAKLHAYGLTNYECTRSCRLVSTPVWRGEKYQHYHIDYLRGIKEKLIMKNIFLCFTL